MLSTSTDIDTESVSVILISTIGHCYKAKSAASECKNGVISFHCSALERLLNRMFYACISLSFFSSMRQSIDCTLKRRAVIEQFSIAHRFI